MKVRTGVTLFLSLAAAIMVVGPRADAALPPTRLACGAHVTTSIKLGNDLVCTGDGIVVDGSGLTIDLGGHRISGNKTTGHAGILLSSGDVGNKITNGVITHFDHNVELGGSDGNTLTKLWLADPRNNAIFLHGVNPDDEARENVITDNVISGRVLEDTGTGTNLSSLVLIETLATANRIAKNTVVAGKFGIKVTDRSGQNIIDANRVIGNERVGISIGGDAGDAASAGNEVTGNRVFGTWSGPGIEVVGPDDTIVEDNIIKGTRFSGISTEEAARTLIKANVVAGGGSAGIISASPDAQLLANNVVGNAGDGIDVFSTGALLYKNYASENGLFGIFAGDGAGATIDNNLTEFNGFLNGLDDDDGFGISAGPETIGENEANGNDVASGANQCSFAFLCPTQTADHPELAECNKSVGSDFALHNPLDCSKAAALFSGADGVTISLGSNWVAGNDDPEDDNGAAVFIKESHTDVVVEGGILADSVAGIVADGDRATIEDSIVSHNGTGISITAADVALETSFVTGSEGKGVEVQGQRPVIAGNTITANVLDGVRVFGNVASGKIGKNKIVGNVENGISLNGFVIEGSSLVPTLFSVGANQVLVNGATGIFASGLRDSTIAKNLVLGSGGDFGDDGIRITGAGSSASTSNEVKSNIITASANDGIELGSATQQTLSGNTVSANFDIGVEGGSSATNNSIGGNKANDNGLHGISVVAGNTVNRNTANLNGFLSDGSAAGDNVGFGIIATPPLFPVSNSADGNDNPNECQPVSICA